MKHKGFLTLFVLAPLTMLCACGGTISNLSFNANWYKNTSLKDNLAGTNEELEYAVTCKSQEGAKIQVEYSDGVYRTKLQNGQVGIDDSQEGYIYTTDLSVKVRFTVNGMTSETFEDSVHSEVQFLSAARGLKPIKSLKQVHCHAPLTDSPASLDSSYAEYDFAYEIGYNSDLSEANVAYTNNLHSQNNTTTNYSLKGDGTFLDNEQLLFALRGLDLSIPVTFRSLNLVQDKMQQVSVTTLDQSTAAVDFVADGQDVRQDALAVNSVTLRYAGSGAGQPQTLIYAKTTDSSSNLYRNVLVEMQVPLYFSLGTVTYQLKNAQFAAK